MGNGRKENADDTALRPEVKDLQRNELTDTIRKLIDIHHQESALIDGSYAQVALTNTACIYARENEKEVIWTCVNLDEQPAVLGVNYAGTMIDLLHENKDVLIRNQITIDARSARILKREK